jgi:hypothetical protein
MRHRHNPCPTWAHAFYATVMTPARQAITVAAAAGAAPPPGRNQEEGTGTRGRGMTAVPTRWSAALRGRTDCGADGGKSPMPAQRRRRRAGMHLAAVAHFPVCAAGTNAGKTRSPRRHSACTRSSLSRAIRASTASVKALNSGDHGAAGPGPTARSPCQESFRIDPTKRGAAASIMRCGIRRAGSGRSRSPRQSRRTAVPWR